MKEMRFEGFVQKAMQIGNTLGVANGESLSQSLEGFYKVRDSVETRTKKLVHTYVFNDDVVKEHGLILVPISDVHLGSYHCNIPYFEAFVNYILNTPNCVTILNGDLAETATKTSVGLAMFEEEMNIPKQWKILEQTLAPLAKAGKILGIGPGNHEERVANLIGVNPMQLLAEKLDVPYFGYQGYFRIVVNGIVYKVSAFHGAGGGTTSSAKTKAAEKINAVAPTLDLYITGHTHGLQSHSDLIYTMDDISGELIPHKRTYVVSGSFLEYWGGYPEMKGLPPSIIGTSHIRLMPHKKDIRVTL